MVESGDTAAAAPANEKGRKTAKITRWVANFALGGAIILVVIVLGAATLARYDIIDKLSGFVPFYMALNPARALVLIAIAGLAFSLWRKSGSLAKLVGALIVSGGMAAAIYSLLVIPGGKVPPIHDITTDLDEPPQFVALDVDTPISTGPFGMEEWRAFHEGAYGDIGPIVIDKAPTEVLADAQAVAEDRGWEIAAYDAEAGRLEATATAGYVRFYDDVIVEVTPVADGSTRVDMRSVSRVGVSDLGYNAARIRDFLADLQAAN